MNEVIEIHFDEEHGHLRLDCGEEEFSHIRDLVVSEAAAGEKLGPYAEGIRFIAVRQMSAVRDTMPKRLRRSAQVVLLLAAVSVALVIQLIGIVVVVRWLFVRGS